ncbi:hypothetical protein [Actinoplanes aureus]|uniref:Uncharacterized protein n=1 Tax=Actinoplanes aureus TaxID=2792083 RepID=A0A931FUT9_9ACTN|nr:hypothetical protein [Actinoplanes aureus]MBG0560593.1 hypothetical protein [Actinoplanes aureus]
MTRLENTVRAAVDDLAATAPRAHDLATAARFQGRRIRRRRRTITGLAAVVLLSAVLVPYAVVDGRRSAPPPTPVAPPPSELPPAPVVSRQWWKEPIRLPGGFVVTAVSQTLERQIDGKTGTSTVANGNLVLDRATGSYRILAPRYQTVIGAPAGRYALVYRANRIGIADTTTGEVRQLGYGPATPLGAQWSPDGTKLLVTQDRGMRFVDPATGTHRDVDTPGGLKECADECFFGWLAGGTEISLPQRRAGSRDVAGIQVYSPETGAVLRTVPFPSSPVSGQNAVSPDGRYVLVDPDPRDRTRRMFVEAGTGRIAGTFVGSGQMHFVAADLILVVSSAEARLYDLSGRLLQTTQMPPGLAGRRISVGRL